MCSQGPVASQSWKQGQDHGRSYWDGPTGLPRAGASASTTSSGCCSLCNSLKSYREQVSAQPRDDMGTAGG